MPDISEGGLTFQFPVNWEVSKYDEWSFYRNQFQGVCGGAKAVDMLALSPERRTWLVEVKDYRVDRRTKPTELAEEVAHKVRDTLAALVCARLNADDQEEKKLASQVLRSRSLGVALHLEQPARSSRLFPRAIDPASIKQKLKQLLKAVDAHPKVFEMGQMRDAPWTVVER